MTRSTQTPHAGRRGFTLVETLATLALLCFIVVVLGPMLVRVSRQSNSVTASQYRTAAMVAATSRAMAVPAADVLAGCTTDATPAYQHSMCTVIVDTLPGLRRLRLVVTPTDSLLTAPDTVTLYRVNTLFTNPFDIP
jgi:prepilin-type N-terminal cleavage/methylation domain-containing protein